MTGVLYLFRANYCRLLGLLKGTGESMGCHSRSNATFRRMYIVGHWRYSSRCSFLFLKVRLRPTTGIEA